jgi:uncharacterized RDD family membrane protein YckC
MANIKRKYRTFVQRFASALIDGIIFLPISLLFDSLADTNHRLTFIFWSFLYNCIWLSYSVYMHGKYGQTFGKMASAVKVYSLDEKSIIGYRKAFMRDIIWISITFPGFVYLILGTTTGNNLKAAYDDVTFYPTLASTILELVTMLLNSKRRALHDLIAGSVVLDITKYKKWDIEYEESMEETK